MNEEKFFKVVSLLKEFSITELRETRRNLMTILSIVVDEKRIASVEVRKAMHNLNISNRSKQKRVDYIDKYLLPGKLKAIKLNVIKEFGDAQSAILVRINTLQREKERIQKNSNEHDLKAKINLRTLIDIYGEEERILNYMNLLSAADLVYNFVQQRRIDLIMLNLTELRDLYVEYMGRG